VRREKVREGEGREEKRKGSEVDHNGNSLFQVLN